MSNDERVSELSKKLNVSLEYSDKIEKKKAVTLDRTKLQKLAQTIRQELEETSLENTVHENSPH